MTLERVDSFMTSDDSRSAGSERQANVHQWRRTWLVLITLGVCVLAALIYPFPVEGRLWSEIFDLAHAPVFCGVTLCVAWCLNPPAVGGQPLASSLRLSSGRLMLVAGGCMLLGSVGEFAQSFAGRSPSVKDLAANAAGVAVGSLWIIASGRAGRIRHLQAALGMLVLLIAIARPILGIQAALRQRADFPLLASFEDPADLKIWEPYNAALGQTPIAATHGRAAMRLQIWPGEFSGATMIWPIRDWRGYHRFECDVQNAGDSDIQLTFKFYDVMHTQTGFEPSDRSERTIAVAPGDFQNVQFTLSDLQTTPGGRQMNMGRVAGIELFVAGATEDLVLNVDNLRLSGAPVGEDRN